MLINAAPRSYTSNIVADADLNLEGYNVTANALYSKDNYLLTMLDYGEAFPTDVKEGDKLFAWGEDSTKSYIYTYKQGAWDAGVKPQHMQDYYIADENRTVKFCNLKSVPVDSYYLDFISHIYTSSSSLVVFSSFNGLLFTPDVYILGTFSARLRIHVYQTVNIDYDSYYLKLTFTDCTSRKVAEKSTLVQYGKTMSLSNGSSYLFEEVVVPCYVNGFHGLYSGQFKSFSASCNGNLYVSLGYDFDI